MATIAENIQTLRSIKSDIKNAIIQKGGVVTDAFGTYAQAITNLPSGGGGGTEMEDALVMRTLSVYYNDRISYVSNYVFYWDAILQSIDLPNCMSIGLNTFYHCSALQSVRLPLCSFINDSAFVYCSMLQSIDLPNCSYIGSSAFGYCSTLSFINLPKCKYIDNAAFGDCENLISIDLPSCINLKDNVFRYCTKLNYISLPLCQYISNAVFFVCNNLFSIYLPNCISMGNYVFATCSNISIIKIPICQYLGSAPFRACSKLKEIYLNSVTSVTKIQSITFSECPNLTSVYVPSSLVDAFKTAQYWSSISSKIVAYTEPTEPTKYPPLVYSAKSAGSTITVNGQPMTLEQGDNIELNYPNEITSVEATDNEELTYLQIPNTVTSINDNAFGGCVALSEITIPDSVKSIGVGAFQTCIGLTSINIPSGVTSISMETFNGCSALTSVTLPEGLTNIGSSTFMDCASLTSITIPSTVTMIDFEAFNYCEALTDFNFNGTKAQWASITKGDDWNLKAAFTVVHCSDGDVTLEEPIQPNKLVYSAKSAGSTITVNGETVTLEQGENIVLDYSNEITSVKATDNTALTAITIPNTMTKITGSAFKNCYYLTNINIPNTITEIYPQAFRDCVKLTSITIPENVKNIYDFAFMGCTKLSDFNYNGTTSQWGSITLDSTWKDNALFTVVHCTDGDVNIL